MSTDTEPSARRISRAELRASQRESEKRSRQGLVPRDGVKRWKDSKGQRYERLPSGQIVRVSE